MTTLAASQMTPIPHSARERKALQPFDAERVLIDSDIRPQMLIEGKWIRSVDQPSGLEIEVRRTACGAGCGCAAVVRLPAKPTVTPKIHELAALIQRDFGPKPAYYAARPYVEALLSLPTGSSHYYEDSVVNLLRYLIGNLSGWRGPQAKATRDFLRVVVGQ